MSRIYFNCVPFDKGDVTLALESGVDGVIVPRKHVEEVSGSFALPCVGCRRYRHDGAQRQG